MNSCFIPFLSVNRWLVWKGVVFALLGLLALDAGLSVTNGFAQSTTGFSISPASFAYTGTVGGPNQVLSVTITNNSTSTLTVTWTDPINWLVATSGDIVTMAPGGSATISHTASTAGLTAGTYSGTASITGGGTTKQMPITMTVTSGTATPAIGLSPASLAFSAAAGAANPATQVIGVSNTGSGTLTWAASDNATWLTLTPASGTNAGTIAASVNTAGLAAGTYNTTVTLSATGVTAKTVPVILTIARSTTTSGFSISPASLTYTGTVGGPNQVLGVTITNTGTSSMTVTWTDPINWLVATSGDTVTMAPGGSATISHTASPAGLTAGTYSGTATITGSGTSKQIPITMTVMSGTATPAIGLSPTSLAFSGAVGGANPATQVIGVSNTGSGTLTWTANDNAAWLTLTPASGTNAGTVAASVNMAGLAAGTYNTTVTLSATGATAKTVPVTLTVTAPSSSPAIGLNPTSLAFSGTAGAANPAQKTFTISNTGGGTLAWATSDTAAWLILSPASGINTGTVTASIAATGLTAGTYSTTVTVSAPGATAKTLPITLTITQSTSTSGFSLSPASFAYTGTVGGPNQVLGVTITNTSTSTLTVLWTDQINWLVATSGDRVTMAPGGSATISHTASPVGLTAGTYSGTATITGGGTTKQVPITMTVTSGSATPAIGLNTTTLGFSGTVGGTNPSAQTIAVSNVGGGTLSWTASDNAAWLTLSPVSGTNSGTVTASVNLTGLAAGTYNAIVTVTASGVPAKTLPVTLTITATTAGATIGFSPTSLTFTGTVGGANPAAKPMNISNTGGGTLSWAASDNAAWLTLSPVSGTNSGTVTASVNMTGLAAGTYNGIITITASGSTSSPQQIPVSMTLSATAANTATLTWNTSTESDIAGYKVYRGTGSGTYGAPLTTLPKTTTSFTATGLQNGTTYFFVITAYDSAGNESTYSNEVSKSIF